MSELFTIMRSAIRWRREHGVTTAEDLDWLLRDNDRLVSAIVAIVDSSDGGADAYEVRHELAAAAEAAGLPSREKRRDRMNSR